MNEREGHGGILLISFMDINHHERSKKEEKKKINKGRPISLSKSVS